MVSNGSRTFPLGPALSISWSLSLQRLFYGRNSDGDNIVHPRLLDPSGQVLLFTSLNLFVYSRTPAKQQTPSIFTSSPKTSLDKSTFDATATSFASLSLSDESFVDTSADTSMLDTSREMYMGKLILYHTNIRNANVCVFVTLCLIDFDKIWNRGLTHANFHHHRF